MSGFVQRAIGALVVGVLALGQMAPLVEAATVHYQRESYRDFQRQMAGGEIAKVTFNKKPHSAHVTLKDGRYVLAIYPSHEEPQLAAQLQARGVLVTVEKHRTAAKPVHHTLRYIAGGILVVVILAILAVLLIGRRRNLAQSDGGESAGGEDRGQGSGPGQAGEASPAP